MADVKRCDICGEIYELFEEKNGVFRVSTVDPDDIFEVNKTECCAVCTKKIEEFIDVMKQYGHNYTITTFTDGGKDLYLD